MYCETQKLKMVKTVTRNEESEREKEKKRFFDSESNNYTVTAESNNKINAQCYTQWIATFASTY